MIQGNQFQFAHYVNLNYNELILCKKKLSISGLVCRPAGFYVKVFMNINFLRL